MSEISENNLNFFNEHILFGRGSFINVSSRHCPYNHHAKGLNRHLSFKL